MAKTNTQIFEYISRRGSCNRVLLRHLVNQIREAYKALDPANCFMEAFCDEELSESLFIVENNENPHAQFELFLSADYFDSVFCVQTSRLLQADVIDRRGVIGRKINEFRCRYNFAFNDCDHANFLYC